MLVTVPISGCVHHPYTLCHTIREILVYCAHPGTFPWNIDNLNVQYRQSLDHPTILEH